MSCRKWKCTLCDKAFRHPFGLQQHVYTHTGERPHKCPLCPKAFYSSNDLRRHSRIHSGNISCNLQRSVDESWALKVAGEMSDACNSRILQRSAFVTLHPTIAKSRCVFNFFCNLQRNLLLHWRQAAHRCYTWNLFPNFLCNSTVLQVARKIVSWKGPFTPERVPLCCRNNSFFRFPRAAKELSLVHRGTLFHVNGPLESLCNNQVMLRCFFCSRWETLPL